MLPNPKKKLIPRGGNKWNFEPDSVFWNRRFGRFVTSRIVRVH